MEPAARRVLARNHFKNLGISLFESAMTWWASEKRIQAISTIEGIEHITNAQAKGRGVILTTFHTTTLSIGARILNTNVPVNPLYRPTKNKVIAYVSACAFQKHAQRPILHTDIRAMVQILKTNGIVWYIADQSYRKKGAMMVPFFNIPTATNVFARRLQEMTQSEVLFYTCERSADGRYHVKVLPPLDWSALDAYHAVLDYHHHIEKAVRHNPSQYWWVHRRFKGLSSSDPDYYSKRQHFP
jgi:KDO2-lipid IV(A) lauroyltransferase